MPVILAEDNEFFRARIRRQLGRKDVALDLPHYTYQCNHSDVLHEAKRAFLTYIAFREGRPFLAVDTVDATIVGKDDKPFRTTNMVDAYNVAKTLPDEYELRVLRTSIDAVWLNAEQSRFIPLTNYNGAFKIGSIYTEENFFDVLEYLRSNRRERT